MYKIQLKTKQMRTSHPLPVNLEVLVCSLCTSEVINASDCTETWGPPVYSSPSGRGRAVEEKKAEKGVRGSWGRLPVLKSMIRKGIVEIET